MTPSEQADTIEGRCSARETQLGPTELRVAHYIRENREEAMVSSASVLAERTNSSDATVIRTVKALGYAGMAELKQHLALELRGDLSLASRAIRTLEDVGELAGDAFASALRNHQHALERLRRDISPSLYQSVVDKVADAARVCIFGVGPSSALANYFEIQLGRFGIDAYALTDTGLLLADGLHRLRRTDLLIMLAFGRPYPEVIALTDHAKALGTMTILITDVAGAKHKRRVEHILPVERGRAESLSMHTATLALIEALLVGIAVRRPTETVANLKTLNALRSKLAGEAMRLPSPALVANSIKPTKR